MYQIRQGEDRKKNTIIVAVVTNWNTGEWLHVHFGSSYTFKGNNLEKKIIFLLY